MTITPDDVQAALLDIIQAQQEVTSFLDDTDEIREDQWQGREFTYQNIRIDLRTLRPDTISCEKYTGVVSWLVFSEEASSAEAAELSGIINNVLHDKIFQQGGLQISLWTTNIVMPRRVNRRLWRGEVLQRVRVASG